MIEISPGRRFTYCIFSTCGANSGKGWILSHPPADPPAGDPGPFAATDAPRPRVGDGCNGFARRCKPKPSSAGRSAHLHRPLALLERGLPAGAPPTVLSLERAYQTVCAARGAWCAGACNGTAVQVWEASSSSPDVRFNSTDPARADGTGKPHSPHHGARRAAQPTARLRPAAPTSTITPTIRRLVRTRRPSISVASSGRPHEFDWSGRGEHPAWRTQLADLRRLRTIALPSIADSWPPPCSRSSPNRTIWFVGNSVMRVHFFATAALLGGAGISNVSKDEQIAQCGKGGVWGGRRPGQGHSCQGPCTCSVATPRGRVAFVWQQKVFDATLPATLGGAHASTSIAPGDFVFLNAGLDDAVNALKLAFSKKGRLVRGPRGEPGYYTGNWTYFRQRWRDELAVAATSMARTLADARRRGVRAFWRSSTPLCQPPANRVTWGGLSTAEVNAMVNHSDALASRALSAAGLAPLDMRAADVQLNGCRRHEGNETAVVGCRCRGYTDSTRLHPGPELASRQVVTLLASAARTFCENDWFA